MAKIVGTYNLESSDNFEEFMKALGVGIVMRKLGNTTKPTIEISEKDGVWTLKTISTVKTTEVKFKLGEEIDEATTDGRNCKTTFTLDGNKLIQVQKAKNGKDAKFTREFNDTGMVLTCECDNVISKRVYKRG